ncbi:hypothetical protein [Alsobacter sp. SYSU BS001988]
MSALHDFAAKALESNRISFGDLRRLQRDVLPQRIATTDEAELLLTVDGALARADRDWNDYLVEVVGEFTLWGMGPSGRITQAKADWLLAALAAARAKTASAVLRQLATQAPQIDPDARIAGRAAARSRAVAAPPGGAAAAGRGVCNFRGTGPCAGRAVGSVEHGWLPGSLPLWLTRRHKVSFTALPASKCCTATLAMLRCTH